VVIYIFVVNMKRKLIDVVNNGVSVDDKVIVSYENYENTSYINVEEWKGVTGTVIGECKYTDKWIIKLDDKYKHLVDSGSITKLCEDKIFKL